MIENTFILGTEHAHIGGIIGMAQQAGYLMYLVPLYWTQGESGHHQLVLHLSASVGSRHKTSLVIKHILDGKKKCKW